jgi:hypothetical protein
MGNAQGFWRKPNPSDSARSRDPPSNSQKAKRECDMEPIRVDQLIADARQPNEVAKLILKLRWIGLEEEALQLERAVHRLPSQQRAPVIGEPSGTD